MRRFFTILAIIIILAGVGAGVYFYLSQKPSKITVSQTNLPSAGNNTQVGVVPSTQVENPAVKVTPRLVQISAGPVVAGEVVFDTLIPSTDASSTVNGQKTSVVHYLARESGNVFSYVPKTGILTRINNKTIPGIQSASWLPDGSLAFVRYLSGDTFSTINTYALSASSSEGFFLPQNISDVAISSTTLLTLATSANGAVGSLISKTGTTLKSVFTTPLTSLRASFAGKDSYLVYTKPSTALDGDAFIVDKTGHFSRIAGPLSGLTALASHSGKLILVSYVTSGNTFHTFLVDSSTGAQTALPIATLTDKCVWSADDSSIYCGIPVDPSSNYSYPDDWYQGAVQFSDRIWKIDVTGRFAQLVLDFSDAKKGALDATNLAIDPLNTTLVFLNKNDGSLWSYSL